MTKKCRRLRGYLCAVILAAAVSGMIASAQIPSYSSETNLLAAKYIEGPDSGRGRFGDVMSYDDGLLAVGTQAVDVFWIYRQMGPTEWALEAELPTPSKGVGFDNLLIDISGNRVAVARTSNFMIYEKQSSGEWTMIYANNLSEPVIPSIPMHFIYTEAYVGHERLYEVHGGRWKELSNQGLQATSLIVAIDAEEGVLQSGEFFRRDPEATFPREWTPLTIFEKKVEIATLENGRRIRIDDPIGFDFANDLMTWITENTPTELYIADASTGGRIHPEKVRVSGNFWGAQGTTAASRNRVSIGLPLAHIAGCLVVFERTESNHWRQLPTVYPAGANNNGRFGDEVQLIDNTVLSSAPGMNRIYILDLDDPTIINHPPKINEGKSLSLQLPPGKPHEFTFTVSDPDEDDIQWQYGQFEARGDSFELLEETNETLRFSYTPAATHSNRQERFTITALDPSRKEAEINIVLHIGRLAPPTMDVTRIQIQLDEDAPETNLAIPELNTTDPYNDPLTWELKSHATLGQAILSVEENTPTLRYRTHPNAFGIERISLVAKNQTTMTVPSGGVISDWPNEDDAPLLRQGNRLQLVRIGAGHRSPPLRDTDRILFRIYSPSTDLVYQRPLQHISEDSAATEAILNKLKSEPWPVEAPLSEELIEDLLALVAPDGQVTFEASLEIEIEIVPHNDVPAISSPIELAGPAIPGTTLSLSASEWVDLETPSNQLRYQ